jgi:hypothetical protein
MSFTLSKDISDIELNIVEGLCGKKWLIWFLEKGMSSHELLRAKKCLGSKELETTGNGQIGTYSEPKMKVYFENEKIVVQVWMTYEFDGSVEKISGG